MFSDVLLLLRYSLELIFLYICFYRVATLGVLSLTPTGEPSGQPTGESPVLLHRYSFDDTAGSTTALDTTDVFAYGGSAKNASVVGSASDLYISNGKATFQGSSISNAPYVDLGADIMEGNEAVTVELWVNATSLTTHQKFLFQFGQAVANTFEGSISLLSHSVGNLIFLAEFFPAYSSVKFTSLVNAHVVTVYNPTAETSLLYVNGLLNANLTSSAALPSSTALAFDIGGL